MSLERIYKFHAVDQRLSTSGQPSEAQLAALAAAGCEVIVNLALHDDPRYSLRDEAASVSALGMTYVHLPVRFEQPTEADLLAFFATMEQHATRRLHIHCAANMRVSAFYGLYLLLRRGAPEDVAFALLHRIWQPDVVWSEFIAAMRKKHARMASMAS